jgi:AraC-like DNA-binding protein
MQPQPAQPLVAATPIAFVLAIMRAYDRHGLPREAALLALDRARIAPEQLADSGARITAWQMQQLSEHAMRALDDEALGWFSRRLPWGSYGMLARASLSAPTLRVALARWCRHHGLIAPDIALALRCEGGVAHIEITELASLPAGMREFCLVSVLRNIHGLACWYIDSRIPLLGACFPFAAPAHAPAYAVLFPGGTTFQAAHAALSFDAQYLQLPLRRDERALRQMLQNALPLTVLQYRRDRLLVQRVRQLLQDEPGAMHSAEALGARMHMSPRTLHRQLKDEGATLQALKDEVRRHRATELLLRSRRPVKQVAEAAGFQSEKSFIRAFRGWTGNSPAEFRRQGTPTA